MTPTSARVLALFALLTGPGAFAACGSDATSPPGSGVGGSGAGSGGGSSGSGGGGTSGTGGGIIDSSVPDGPNLDANCGLVTENAKSTPLHLYIMMDKSSSMVNNKWDAAVAGLTAFVQDSASDGVYVGLKFFPRDPNGVPLCDQPEYAKPDVPFGVLPQNAASLVTALGGASPDGLSTPTYPALGGAILAGIQNLQNNPGHAAAVLLVTDGVPQGPAATCGSVNPEDAAVIAGLAATGLGKGVVTYVIGLPGVNQSFANQVALAGGSDAAILVSNTNVQKEFTDALAKVRGQALPCEYDLPEQVGKQFDKDHVNVQITPGSGVPATIKQTKESDCGSAPGWYYDASPPTKIILCPSVCAGLKQDFGAQVQIVLGCPTLIR